MFGGEHGRARSKMVDGWVVVVEEGEGECVVVVEALVLELAIFREAHGAREIIT